MSPKIYYSENPDSFEPWTLENAPKEHRHFIQAYFDKQYKLEVSVRPAYKEIEQKNENIFLYHAQVQTGNHDFWEFSKWDKIQYEKIIIKY